MSRELLIVCTFTRGTPYAEEARRLTASAARFGYAVRAIDIPDQGNWWQNAGAKMGRVLGEFRRHEGPLLFLDADCRVLRPLDEMLRLLDDADMAMTLRADHCFTAMVNSGVVLMRKSPGVLAVLEHWATAGIRFARCHRFADQGALLEGIVLNQHRVRCRALAEKYHSMVPLGGDAPAVDCVIAHLKASRVARTSSMPPGIERAETRSPVEHVALRPMIAEPRPIPIEGVDGQQRDFVEYAGRWGAAASWWLEVPAGDSPIAGDKCLTEANRKALDGWRVKALATLCQRLPVGTRVMVSDFDVVYLQDPHEFAQRLDEADLVVAWDRASGGHPATATMALCVGPSISQFLLPRVAAESERLSPQGSAVASFAAALGCVLDSTGDEFAWTAVPRELVANLATAGPRTVSLCVRAPLRAFHHVNAPHYGGANSAAMGGHGFHAELDNQAT